MSNYFVEESFKTPKIVGDSILGTLVLSGRSLPEDAKNFYQPFREWLHLFYGTKSNQISVTLDLEYFNTASSKFIVNMLFGLEKLQTTKKVIVKWMYDEEDVEMLETGQDFKNLVGDMITMETKTI